MENLTNIKDYKKENEDFYNSMNQKLDYLLQQQKDILTEQEKQRIRTMTIEEVQTEMLRVLHEMKLDINKLSDLLERGEE
ncbi:hypothetical protein [Anaerosalibacter massiliensis]|uniref:hypothetical protein n=1 Tax=Anaerosalibacter massiliensis TaxID=1347392 RepID=UPI0005B2E0ED|nr:hypothetical protein [Anaerosalibacter massiliensis]